MVVRLALEAGAGVLWREELVFGRYGEPSGRCRSRFDAVLDGRPLLRQELTVGDPAVDGGPAVYGDARCVGGTLIAGSARPSPSGLHRAGENGAAPGKDRAPAGRQGGADVGEGWAVLPLAGPGVLVTALGRDTVELRRRLELGESRVSAR